MKKAELKSICEGLNVGDNIIVRFNSMTMTKYGDNPNVRKKFVPRTLNYPPQSIVFSHLSFGEYLCGENRECFYYSKINSIEKKNQ